MNKYLTIGLLISGSALAAPSASAPALGILTQKGALCYSATITVNDKVDTALNKQAEAIMLKTLKGLSLSAEQYDAAKMCDRELVFLFSVNNAGAPTIYQDELKLATYLATDGPIQLPYATVWRSYDWGGDVKIWTTATFTKKMQDNLVVVLSDFTVDYRSVVK